MPRLITVLCSSRAIIDDKLIPATISVSRETGKILSVHEGVLPKTDFPSNIEYHDVTPHVLMPGIVDAHVHLNEPGRTEWEGFDKGSQAAAFGGVTTLIDMPLNAIPPTTTVANLEEKVAAARGKCWVDVGFYGGIIPGNEGELVPLVRAGVRGFKGFLCDSGVEEFPALSPQDVAKVLETLADEPTTILFHAEMTPDEENASPACHNIEDETINSRYQTFLDSRPPDFETKAVSQIIKLSHLAPKLHLHIVHLSAMQAIPLLRSARQSGVNITAETCFHYLALAAEQIPESDTRHKCCPPIRDEANQSALWNELLDGRINGTRKPPKDAVLRTIVSDHSPCTPDLKFLPPHIAGSPAETNSNSSNDRGGNFLKAWGGISSVGLGISILWTKNKQRTDRGLDGFNLPDLSRWCSVNTALQVGLSERKGRIAPGYDADMIVFDDARRWRLERSRMLFRNKCSPYQDKEFVGKVCQTWLRGRRVWDEGRAADGFGEGTWPIGELLLEPRPSCRA